MDIENRTSKRILGDLGEDIACKFLVRKGFGVIERNYWRKWGEIDIIVKKDRKLHFIEVKTVSCEIIDDVSHETSDKYRPEDNMHEWKLKRLSRIIQTYLIDKNVSCETDWQFDVITVYIDQKRLISKVFMLENVIL